MPKSNIEIRRRIKILSDQLREIKLPGAKYRDEIVKNAKGRYNAPFKDIVLELANLHRQLKENTKAAQYYEQLFDHSAEPIYEYNPNKNLFAKADMFRQLGLDDEAEKIYISILDSDGPIANAKLGNAIRNALKRFEHHEILKRYFMALKGLGNLYRDRSLNSSNSGDDDIGNNIFYTKAIQFYLEAFENLPRYPAEIFFDLDSALTKIQTFRYDDSLLSVGLLYEKLHQTDEAIGTYTYYLDNYVKRTDYHLYGDHPINIRKAALRLAKLTNNLKYYGMATSHHYDYDGPQEINEQDIEWYIEELKALNEYISIIDSKKHKQTLSPDALLQNHKLIQKKYTDAEQLIRKCFSRFLNQRQEWLEQVKKLSKFKAYATIIEMEQLARPINENTAFFSELKKEVEAAALPPKIKLLLKIIQSTMQKDVWFSKADLLVDGLLASEDVENFKSAILLAELYAKNHNSQKFKEIFDKIIQKLFNNDLSLHEKKYIFNTMLNTLSANILLSEQEVSQYKIIINKYLLDNLNNQVKSRDNLASISLAQYNLAESLKMIEEYSPEIIKQLENQLQTELHDSTYWFRQAIKGGKPEAFDKYYSLIDAKLNKMPEKYKERLEEVLMCDLVGMGSIICEPVSILVKLKGKYHSKTYNADTNFMVLMHEESKQTSRETRKFHLVPQKIKDLFVNKDFLVNIVDPSTKQVISNDIFVKMEGGYYLPESSDIIKKEISKVIMPNKVLADLIDYIVRSDTIDISNFAGFIDPKTGKRFIEPWLTKNGDTVEKGDPRAYCPNTKALEIMRQFPSIKESLSKVAESFATNQPEVGLEKLFLAAEQAELEGSERFSEQAKQMLMEYIATSKNPVLQYLSINQKESFISIIENILQKILGNDEYAALKEIIMCPITFECMLNPVTLQSGHTYEKSAIKEHLIGAGRDPVTNKVINDTSLISNKAIASIIPQIIIMAHENKPINLSELSGLRDKGGNFYAEPYLTENGTTVEKGDPKAIRPNHMLKILIKFLDQTPKLKPTL